MSGGEAALVLGLISSCIAIIDTSKKLLDATQDERGLPEAFRAVDTQLPLILGTLRNIKSKSQTASDSDCATVAQAVKSCEENAEALQKVLQAVMTGEKDGLAKRYYKHVKSIAKGHKVEVLAQQILRQLQHLQANHIFANVATTDDLQAAISQLENIDDGDGTYNSYGSGPINVARDGSTQYNHNYSGNFKSDGVMHIGPVYHGQQAPSTPERCLQSLAFSNCRRRQDTKTKTDGTCDWILRHNQYRKWIGEGGSLLIEGWPGTGKTTLMESILKTDVTQDPGWKSGTFVASFFFYRRGDPLQYSTLGFFRSLLHQLLSQDEELLASFAASTKFEERCKNEGIPGPGKKWDWSESDLQERVKDFARRFLQNRYLQLYIDGLDESGETGARELWHYLKELLEQNKRRLSVCISCRPYPDAVFNPDYKIIVENENQHDIATYVRTVFRAEERWQSRPDLAEIERTLRDRALGVFQWIVLVVQRLLPLQSESKEFIIMEIGKIPTELSALYEDMLQSLIKENKEDAMRALRILRWITFAVRPLSVTELRYAVAIQPSLSNESTQLYMESVHWCEDDSTMVDRVKRLSRGLAKVIENEYGRQNVQFDHESVKEYMSTGGILLLEKETNQNIEFGNVDGRAHYILCRASIQYFASAEPQPPLTIKPPPARPFMEYATGHWMIHAKIVEHQGLPLGDMMMALTEWPSNEIWVRWRQLHGWRVVNWTLQHVVSMYGLRSVLEQIITKCGGRGRRKLRHVSRLLSRRANELDASDDIGRTPLFLAAEGGHEQVVKMLLDTGKVKVDLENIWGETPLHLAAERGRKEVVKMLLDTGKAKVDSKNMRGETPLHLAAGHGRKGVVKMLLDTGKVKVDSENIWGETPLHLAAERGRKEVVKMLLDTGKVKVDLENTRGETPLHLAVEGEHKEVAKMLMQYV